MAYRRTPQIQGRLDAQHTRILAAAADLLAEHGYAACSIAAVAARAGIAAGTVYKHFAGKGELAAELFRTVASREVIAVDSAAAGAGSATDALTAIVETFALRAMKQPRRAYALLAEPVDPGVEELRLQFRVGFHDVVAAAVRNGIESGQLPPQNPGVVAAAIVGAVGEALVGPLATGSHDPDTVPTLVEFTHRAVGGPVRAHP